MTTLDFTTIAEVVTNFDHEVDIHKTVLEASIKNGTPYCPMCIFYTSPDRKDYLITFNDFESNEAMLPKLSEALHFYSARDCSAVVISIVSRLNLDDVMYDSLNFFIAARHAAYIYYLPFSHNEGVVTWHTESSLITELAHAEMDATGSSFVNLLHAHINVDTSVFDAAEVLNYLSYHNFAIQPLDENNIVSYIDLSSFALPSPLSSF